MTYGRVNDANHEQAPDGAVVSHSAELVRGDFFAHKQRPPHPPFGHLLPKGRRNRRALQFIGTRP